MDNLRTLDSLQLDGKTVLLRTDYNVPISDGKVHDDFRIRASLPTIKYLQKHGCGIIIVTHLGRPDGKPAAEFSLRPVATRLADLLRQKITFANTAPETKPKAGEIVLLENLRFDPGEEANDPALAKQLAGLADVYVDDAFAAIHRAHASIVGVTTLLPSAAGMLVQQEVETLHKVLNSPDRPFLAVIGGAKVADKIELIEQLIARADALFVGGAMANTFLASQGIAIGASKHEPDELNEAKRLLAQARSKNVRVILPSDVVVTAKIADDAKSQTINLSDTAPEDIIVDVGPNSIKAALDTIKDGGTVLWNGPLGVDEIPEFAKGTLKLARGIIASKAFSVIGGGDTADVLDKAGLHKKFSFVSTGGGAALELLAGKDLPGIVALQGTEPEPVSVHTPDANNRLEEKVKTSKWIVANWKANTTLPGAIKLAEASNKIAKANPATELIICPPSIYTSLLRHGLGSLYVKFGVQDISQFETGTHTGDLPASIAAQMASYTIIGHSERRAHHETDQQVAAKVHRALQAGLQPVICIGDRLVDKQHGHSTRRVHDQLESALSNVTAEDLENILIAYEPVWAISSGDGHGNFATPRDVEKMSEHIRVALQAKYGQASQNVRILYGGSVNPDNARAFLDLKNISGLLVGGASLDAYQLEQIVKAA